MANRWWIYQRERFPILAHGSLIAAFSFSAVSFSHLLRQPNGWPQIPAYVVAFLTAFIFFLQLRIADEWKDFAEDSKYRPYRPVPRGLVKRRELAVVGVMGGCLQLALAFWLEPPQFRRPLAAQGLEGITYRVDMHLGLPVLLMGVWLYLALMSKEFFVRDWIKARPVTYLWTHMLIIPLIDFYATSCDWMPSHESAPAGLFWFLAVSFFNGVVIEIGRKIRVPAQEENGVQTYSSLWGMRRAASVWFAALLVTGFCAWRSAVRIQFTTPIVVLLASLLTIGLLFILQFMRDPSHARARRFEHFSGAWTLILYLSLGALPLLWRNLASR